MQQRFIASYRKRGGVLEDHTFEGLPEHRMVPSADQPETMRSSTSSPGLFGGKIEIFVDFLAFDLGNPSSGEISFKRGEYAMAKLSIASFAVAFFIVITPVAAQQQPAQLPEGDGKALVQGTCTACHELNQITRSSGYSREGWRELIQTMINLSGTPAGETTAKYLATHFPANNELQPKLVTGDTSIKFREWTTPTLGQRARDPVQAPDGSIWWAGCGPIWWGASIRRPAKSRNILCLKMLNRTASLPIRKAISGTRGTATAPSASSIRAQARSPSTKCRIPQPAIHTLRCSIRRDFVVHSAAKQHGGAPGSSSGDIKLARMPTANSRPYGIRSLRTAALGFLQRQQLPRENRSRDDGDPGIQITGSEVDVRRLDFASDGTIWYVNSALGAWDVWTRRPGRPRSGLRRADRSRILMPSRWLTISSGTTNRPATGRARPIRSGDRTVPKLARSVRRNLRRHHSSHAPDAGRQPADPSKQHKPHHLGDAQSPNHHATSEKVGARTSRPIANTTVCSKTTPSKAYPNTA